MRRTIRSLAVAPTAALALLAGCSALPFAMPAFSHEVVLNVPSGTAREVAEKLGHRLDVAGITDRGISSDSDTVTVRYNPPQKDGTKAAVSQELFTAPGMLGIRPLTAIGPDTSVPTDCATNEKPCTSSTETNEVLALGPAIVTGAHVRTAKAVGRQGQWGVQLDFTTKGAAALKKLSDAVSCQEGEQLKRIAILLDGKMLTAPVLPLECGQSLPDSVELAGGFDRDKATQTAALLATPLPPGVTMVASKP